MKKFFSTLLVTTVLFTATAQKARSAEVVLITAGGVVATMAVVALGAAGYGSSLVTLASFGKSFPLKSETYEQMLDVVASQDEELMTDEVRSFVAELRSAEPKLEVLSDMDLVSQIVDGLNQF